MLVVPLSEAKPGLKLAAPVANPEQPGQTLLRSGYVLEATILKRLADLNVEYVLVEYPGMEDLDRHLAAYLSPARQAIYQQIKKGITEGQKATKANISYADYYSTTRDLVTTLLSQGETPIYMDMMQRMGDGEIAHATAVAHLSLILGIKLEQYIIAERQRLPAHRAKEVVNLGVAGMLHDMGKCKLPEHLRKHTEVNPPENDPDRKMWMSHCRLGYEMIQGGVEPTAASAVMHHHQHFDGTGFPGTGHDDGTKAPLEGKKIHIFARIVHAADLWDRLSVDPTDGNRRPNLQVHHLLRTTYAPWLDPQVARALAVVAPPYPPGTKLTLTDGTVCLVTRVDPVDPYYPVVRRLVDDGWTLDPATIDLKQPNAPGVLAVGKHAVKEWLPESAGTGKVKVRA